MSGKAGGAWGTRRRAWAWVNFFLQIAFLLGFLVLVNLLARKAGGRFDLTSRRSFGLDPVTIDALRRLDYDLEVWMTSPEYALGVRDDKSVTLAWQRTNDLLEEFRKRTGRLRVTYVNPVDGGELAGLRRHWPKPMPNTIYLLATHGPDRTNRKTVDVLDLYEGDPRTGVIRNYRGEGVLLQAIRELAVSTKRVVYQTSGHQELIMEDQRTMGLLAQHLTGHEGFEFRRLETAAGTRVPDDARLVLVLGPAQVFTPPEVDVLREYLERGGSLFVALNARTATGLEKFLEEYGVKADPSLIVHDLTDCITPRLSHLVVRRFNASHEINRIMSDGSLLMHDSCTVEPVEKGPGWKTVPLAQSGPESWGEKGPLGPDARPRPDGDEPRGEQNLIVAVEKSLPKGGKGKLVVWGSAIPLTNIGLSPGGFVNRLQIQYLVNTFRWLMDREVMEVGSVRMAIEPLQMSPRSVSQVKWITRVAFPLVGVILGILAWLFRRK